MKKLRKVNSAKRKQERKDAQENMERQAALFSKHPTECCACGGHFERSRETVKTWQVTIREERVHLTCPECWSIIQEGLERIQND
jgi:predicted RNA-binding Zn-ribbon protein involved in translation (DUF1610 family)